MRSGFCHSLALVAGAIGVGWSALAAAAPLQGDLDGDGAVGAGDQVLLETVYASSSGNPDYDAAGDLDADGTVGLSDLARFGAAFGQSGGDVDTTPPALLLSLNQIPDDMNELLVVPPEQFQITVELDSLGGSLIDPASLVVTSALDMGAHPAGSNLGPLFSFEAGLAVWEVPAGSDLARATHTIDVSVSDLAGNLASESYSFAVRDFAFGPPLGGSPQVVFVDFDADNVLGPEADFLESLREFGLSSAAQPAIEAQARELLVPEILARIRGLYGLEPDGSPGEDPVNIAFVSSPPGGDHSRICVGGESNAGGLFLGSALLDVSNLNDEDTACSSSLGVFPHAIDNLWGSDPGFQSAFAGLDPDLGGTPFGEGAYDAALLEPSFVLETATGGEFTRAIEVLDAADAFVSIVAVAVAHEVGHLLGLSAPGPTPGGLFGGEVGGKLDHNVTPGGATPAENFVMNAGASFTFDEITGRGGSLPEFRPLSQAYLKNRLAINANVSGLYPPPEIDSIEPDPLVYPDPFTPVVITIDGEDFLDDPVSPLLVELLIEGDPTPNLLQVVSVTSDSVTARIQPILIPPGCYDVRLVNADDQVILLPDELGIIAPGGGVDPCGS